VSAFHSSTHQTWSGKEDHRHDAMRHLHEIRRGILEAQKIPAGSVMVFVHRPPDMGKAVICWPRIGITNQQI